MQRAVLLVLLVVSAGCVAEAPEITLSHTSYFSTENGTHYVFAYFNLTRAQEVRYRFDVGDGGTASACLIVLGDEGVWVDPPKSGAYRGPETFACMGPREEGHGSARLDSGAYVFAIQSVACEAKDCRLRWGHDVPAPSLHIGNVRPQSQTA